METSRCVVVYKSLKSRQVNFQPLKLFSGIKRIVFSLLRLKFGQRAGKQELEMQVFIQEQSKVPSQPEYFFPHPLQQAPFTGLSKALLAL